jgi:glycosyltransferase involved in cell wall biosynthesis
MILMKIGLVIYGSLDTISGGYYYDRRLVDSLEEYGDNVHIFNLPYRSFVSNLFQNFSFRLPPDLDLIIQDELCHPSLILANRRAHPYPVISLVHHLRSSESGSTALQHWIERSYLRSVDGFICNSAATRQSVYSRVGVEKPVLIAYPPVDRFKTRIRPYYIRERADRMGPLRLVFIGNIIPRKGLHIVLDAIERLPDHTVSLDVIGDMTSDRRYTRRIRKQVSGLAEKASITLHDYLEDTAVQAILKRAHLMVLPSSYEGFGIAFTEGLYFGLPVIATTAGAAGEIIRSGQNGYLIRPGDSTELAGYLETLQADRDLLKQLSLNARKSRALLTSWNQTTGDIRMFLSKMVEHNG